MTVGSDRQKYDRDRVAKEFDEMVTSDRDVDDWYPDSDGEVPHRAGDLAFQRLELTEDDVLLDAGCGAGKYTLRAAKLCKQAIGIDVSRESLKMAQKNAKKNKIENAIFAYGALEEPEVEIALRSYGITKIFANYALHHLPDEMKQIALKRLRYLLQRPGKIVIGDIMFFDDPKKHRDKFDEAFCDDGETDFPSYADFLVNSLQQLSAQVTVEKLHPLVGVVVGNFN
jgi:ubiquinone/menaquinone biosynthesis C-methylase UbiE